MFGIPSRTIFRQTKFSVDKIYFRHFCPSKFCPIWYLSVWVMSQYFTSGEQKTPATTTTPPPTPSTPHDKVDSYNSVQPVKISINKSKNEIYDDEGFHENDVTIQMEKMKRVEEDHLEQGPDQSDHAGDFNVVINVSKTVPGDSTEDYRQLIHDIKVSSRCPR